MELNHAEHVVRRFQALGWRAQYRSSEFDTEWLVDAENADASEFYTCRRFISALELLAILRARAADMPSSRADEIIDARTRGSEGRTWNLYRDDDFHGF